MRPKRATVAMALLGLLTLAGCGVGGIIDDGDEMLARRRGVEAVSYYEKALARKPELAEDPEFMQRLTMARALAGYQEGERLGTLGQWEAAVASFERSAATGLVVPELPQALAEAKVEASRQCHERALDHADAGRLNEAIRDLRKALQYDPNNPGARDALDAIEGRKAELLGQSQEFYERALDLQQARRWAAAADALRAALAVNPNHVPARVKLNLSETKLAEVRGHRQAGQRLLRERRLDEAIAAFEAALATRPQFAEAEGELAAAREQRRVAQGHLDEARRHAAADRWDDAARSAHAALGTYPHFGEAQALLATARREAASAHVRRGNDLLVDGQLEAAEAEFNAALSYAPNDPAALEGLALADVARGDAVKAEGLLGNALLWYTRAAEHMNLPRYTSRVAETRAAIEQRVAFRLGVQTMRGADAEARQLVGAIFTEAMAVAPAFVSLVNAAGDYTAAADVTRIETRQRIIAAENRTHLYAVQAEAANPEVARLHDRIARERRELHRLRRTYRDRDDGRGDRRDRDRRDGHREHDRDRNPPPLVRAKIREIERLEDRLAREPATVIVETQETWPYVVETHELTGLMLVDLRVTDAADGRVILSDTIRSESSSRDETIQGANPQVGLPVDPLALPSEADVRNALRQAAAKQTAGEVIEAALRDRVSAAQQRADGHSAAGRDAEAVEAYVEAATLVRPLDSGEAERVMSELRRSFE